MILLSEILNNYQVIRLALKQTVYYIIQLTLSTLSLMNRSTSADIAQTVWMIPGRLAVMEGAKEGEVCLMGASYSYVKAG